MKGTSQNVFVSNLNRILNEKMHKSREDAYSAHDYDRTNHQPLILQHVKSNRIHLILNFHGDFALANFAQADRGEP